MGDLLLFIFLCTPFLFAVGMAKPALFAKLFGGIPTRLAIAKVSGVLFIGSFVGAGVTLDSPPSSSSAEVVVEEKVETRSEELPLPDLTKPLAESTITNSEITPTEQSSPEIETPNTYVEPEPVVQEPVYVPPVVEPEPEPTTPGYICSYNAYNCEDFSSWSEANEIYNYCISVGAGDIHDLDRDNDGACDSLK